MARIVNPQNIDIDDDAIFAGALSQGLIWIEDDDSYNDVPLFEMVEVKEICGDKTYNLKGHTEKINTLAINHEFLVSGSSDKTVRVWNWKTGQALANLKGHTDGVNRVILSGDFVVSASLDKTVRVWNWKTGQLLRENDEFKYDISDLALTDQFIFTVSVKTIRIWNWKTGDLIQTYHDGTDSIIANEDLLLTIASSNSLRVKNWKTNQPLHRIHVDGYVEAFFLKDDLAIFFDEYDGIRVWDWKTGARLNTSEIYSKFTNEVLHTPSNLSFEDEENIYVYDAESNKCYYHLRDDLLKFSSDYLHVITTDTTGDIRISEVHPHLRKIIMREIDPEQRSSTSNPKYDVKTILDECRKYILSRNEKWVNFTRIDQHIRNTFPQLNLRKLKGTSKKYKHLRKLTEDYPQQFLLRPDEHKSGLFYISLADNYRIDDILAEVGDFIRGRNEKWVNFTRVDQHTRNTFPQLDLRQIQGTSRKYKHLRMLIEDYPEQFTLRPDKHKQGLFYIRLTD